MDAMYYNSLVKRIPDMAINQLKGLYGELADMQSDYVEWGNFDPLINELLRILQLELSFR